jgi:hypothetical protein
MTRTCRDDRWLVPPMIGDLERRLIFFGLDLDAGKQAG